MCCTNVSSAGVSGYGLSLGTSKERMLGRRIYIRVQSPECGLETVAQMPPFPHCRVAVVPSDTVAQVRSCTRMRGCVGPCSG